MKAMILAAGLGTRLRPLTDHCPKALVKVNGIPLLELAIRRLVQAGCREIVINIHHFGDQIIDFLKKRDNTGLTIHISDERKQLLNTGGAIKKAIPILGNKEPFILLNADILSNIDLEQLYQRHREQKALATLAVRQRSTSRFLIFDQQQLLSGWTNVKTGALKMARAQAGTFQYQAFSGIHVISPSLLDWMPEAAAFSIIDTYLEAATKERILAYPHDEDLWLDVGKPEALEKAGALLEKIYKK